MWVTSLPHYGKRIAKVKIHNDMVIRLPIDMFVIIPDVCVDFYYLIHVTTEMDCCTVQLDEETNKSLSLYLFKNVENTREIRKKVINGELQCCILKAALIVDPFQIIVAANKAVVNEKFGKLTTRTIFTEILFNLSLSKNITQSLTKFGIDDKEKNIIIAIIHETNDDAEVHAKNILAVVKGERISISRLKEITDLSAVKKTYKIDESELKVSNIIDSVTSRMNTKDFTSY